jgi:hypothetical protein
MLRPYKGWANSVIVRGCKADCNAELGGETGSYAGLGQGTTGTACRALTWQPINGNYELQQRRHQLWRTNDVAMLRRAHRSPLLEAFATEHGPTLCRTKRNCRFFTALRASRLCLGAHRRGAVCAAAAFRTLGLARLAALGFVFEAFVGEKHLLAGSKHKLRIAFRALQYFVVEFHEPPPLARSRARGMSEPCTVGPGRGKLPPPGGKPDAASSWA